MCSSSDSWGLSNTHCSSKDNDIIAAIDKAILALKICLSDFETKAKYTNSILEAIDCPVSYLPDTVRRELKDIFSDNEVFNFHSADSRELVTINPQHVLNSLQECRELADLERMGRELEATCERLRHTTGNIQQKLRIEKGLAESFSRQASEKAAQAFVFRSRLESARRQLESLQQVSQTTGRPRYNPEEIQSLQQEERKLEESVALTTSQLAKYHSLPLHVKDAAKQLAKLKEELINVENEIKRKVIR